MEGSATRLTGLVRPLIERSQDEIAQIGILDKSFPFQTNYLGTEDRIRDLGTV